MKAPGKGRGTLTAIDCGEGVRREVEGKSVARAERPAGERRMVNVVEIRKPLDLGEWPSLSTMYGD